MDSPLNILRAMLESLGEHSWAVFEDGDNLSDAEIEDLIVLAEAVFDARRQDESLTRVLRKLL